MDVMGSRSLPLAGRRVLDLSMLTPGPFATQVLADLGATVLKVERPPLGDLERVTMPAYFRAYNRGKHSIALDLRQHADLEFFRSLVPDADVVVEGFRPGVVERLGVGFESLRELQPRLVYVSLSGFGPSGPRVKERAHDPEFQALAGSLHYSRGTDGKPVYNTGGPIFDYAAGLYAVIGILATLQQRDRGAVHLEVPCFAAGLSLMFPRLVDAAEMDREIANLDIIMAGSDGEWLTVAAPEDNTWPPLCAAIGRPDLAEREDLQTFDGRLAHVEEINDALRAAVRTRPRDEWAERLAAAGVPSAPVLSPRQVLADAQVRHLDLVRTEPSMHALLPIFGLASRANVGAPVIDQDGAAVRRAGWAALGGDGA
jgi:CoA:oxalate CoA-transferase